ncbi:hypothetical protein BDV12DRAFT_194571 [Aspergillus spectabilis]
MSSSYIWTSSWFFSILATFFLFPSCIQTKAVFAHFMMSNTANYTSETWKTDILAAQSAHIDAFALNSGFGMAHTLGSISDVFAAAAETDFKLFFSFDYAGSNGTWPKDQVVQLLNQYTTHPAYFQHGGKPLVSTFEGFQAAGDWAGIKHDVGEIAFIPDWTSVGPRRASRIAAIDGLMCWDAWPDGITPMDTTEDEEYMSILGDRLYIMPVSPWFYTKLEQFNKNWVWQGGGLWYTRWQQVLELDPNFVEILTWNDYGESHYIGPLHDEAVGILAAAGAPFNYVDGMPHDGWRVLLPYLIQQYKAGSEKERKEVNIEEELLTAWYRLSPAKACSDGNTTGNTEDQGQTILDPGTVLEDRVFYSALLKESADVAVSIGGENWTAEWTNTPDNNGGRGIYYGSASVEDREGEVVVTLSRREEFLAQMAGKSIEIQKECPRNQTNWNAWVGNATAVESGGVRSASWSIWMMMIMVITVLTGLF